MAEEVKAVEQAGEIKIKVEPHFQGITLIKYLKKNKIGIPYALIQKLLRKKAIKVNGKRVKEEQILEPNDEIVIPAFAVGAVKIKKQVATKRDAEKLIKIIYEDKNCVAIDKPQGLATQGGNRVSISVDDLLPFMAKNGEKYFLTHRLDKDTTGVLLIAKTRQAAQLIGDSFKHKFVEKKYLALVAGKVLTQNGYIAFPLGKRGSTGGSEKVMVDEENGKKAYTEYRVLENFGPTATLLEITPKTGRKHQIRVHLAAIDHPIIGDGKYGGSKAFVEGLPKTLHLHAWKLSHSDNYFKPITAEIPKRFSLTGVTK